MLPVVRHSVNRRSPLRLAARLIAAASLLGLVACQQDAGIRYVDNARLFREVTAFVAVRDSVEAYKKEWQSHANPLKDSLDAYMKRVGDNRSPLSDQQRQGVEAEFRARQDTLQRFVEGSQKRAAEMEKNLTDAAVKRVNAQLDRFREEKGYSVVLGTTVGGNILTAEKSLDVTDAIIQYVNAGLK